MPLEKITLDNGLKVYVARKPIGKCGVYLIVNAGSAMDKVVETAHVAEHLQGANCRVYGDRFPLNYAVCNATTHGIKTDYFFCRFLPKHLETAVDNLSRVLLPPDLTILDREKSAVFHELKMQNNAGQHMKFKACKALFPVHYKRKPDIHKRLHSLKNITPEAVMNFWSRHYSPANSKLILAGDLPDNPDKLLDKFASIPQKGDAPKEFEYEEESEISGRIEIKERIRDDQTGSICIAYRSPTFPYGQSLREEAAKLVLTNYLCNDSGPAYQRMRDEKNLCYGLTVGYTGCFGKSDEFSFGAGTGNPELIEKIEEEWVKILQEVAEKGVDEKVLETQRNGLEIQIADVAKDTDIDGLIMEIDFGVSRKDLYASVESLTSQNIQKAAQYFAKKPYVVSIALPKKKS